MVRYVTIKKFAEESGYTEKAIYNKVNDGTWLEDLVWKRAPDGRILIDNAGYERWVEGELSPHTCAQKLSRSPSVESPLPLTVSGIKSPSPLKP